MFVRLHEIEKNSVVEIDAFVNTGEIKEVYIDSFKVGKKSHYYLCGKKSGGGAEVLLSLSSTTKAKAKNELLLLVSKINKQ